MKIPFNKVYLTGDEEQYVIDALHSGQLCGNHKYCKKVLEVIRSKYGFESAFLVPSGTAALEMGVVLADLQPGDEVILPSYTFSSTVNAVVLFGGKPVFCEVDPTTMNIDHTKIESLITPRTKMIIPIDYAGLPCEIDDIMEIANRHHLIVLQDCAQSFGSYYKGKPCGSHPHIAAFSFHETKNYCAGEGGLLVVNVPEWHQRATFLQEKGTDRSLVINGQKNKYSWVDKGSSYLLSDMLAAMLYAQLEHEEEIKTIVANAVAEAMAPFRETLKKITNPDGNDNDDPAGKGDDGTGSGDDGTGTGDEGNDGGKKQTHEEWLESRMHRAVDQFTGKGGDGDGDDTFDPTANLDTSKAVDAWIKGNESLKGKDI